MLEHKCLYLPNEQLRKGDIVFAYVGKANIKGSEQQGDRPYLIIQNDIGNKFSKTVIAVPITDEYKKQIPTHMKMKTCNGVTSTSTALFEQIRTLDKSRIGFYLGSLDPTQFKEMNKKLKIALDLF